MQIIASHFLCFVLAVVVVAQEKSFESLPCEESTAIEFARFYPATQKMEMAFKGRPEKVYSFDFFPQDIWLMWCASKSKGKFYLRNIKGVKFERSEKEDVSRFLEGSGVIGVEE